MDFEKILRVARKNELNKKEPVKCLQTKFRPPTKEQHEKDKLLSEGVQRFLARKEEEEQRKQKEAERRKLELMALRAKDPKANRRIQTMLKRTKSANKSVMEDAVDNNNTADTLAGPSQPDEDDYGFVSETSSQLYNKLIQKMYSTPSDDGPKFAPSKKPTCNLSNTKERVKMALLKQEEEERLPHKRKRKSKGKNDEEEDEDDVSSGMNRIRVNAEEPIKEKPKVKKPMPPPVDFQQLLKIAEQKQHEPIVFEPKIKKPQEPEVLMTKKQKIEFEKMQEWKRQRELRFQNLENGGSDQKKSFSRIPKLNSESARASSSHKKVNGHDEKSNKNSAAKIPEKSERNVPSAKFPDKGPKAKSSLSERKNSSVGGEKKVKETDDETSRLKKERDEALRLLREKERLIRERDEAVRILKEKEQLIKERDEVVRKLKLLEQSEKLKTSGNSGGGGGGVRGSGTKITSAPRPVTVPKKLDTDRISGKGGVNHSKSVKANAAGSDVAKSQKSLGSALPKTNLKPGTKPSLDRPAVREFPPKDLKPSSAANRSVVQRSKQFPPADVRRKALAVKRRRIESDDEYDSELDDFIDDDTNDIGSEEVSKVISEIFRYDKNKYSKYDDMDDECMESNYAQISKEEYFSTKCGILEDLQDIQREKAKMARKQKR